MQQVIRHQRGAAHGSRINHQFIRSILGLILLILLLEVAAVFILLEFSPLP